ncbi:MAG: DUF262 domain-containing protein [Acidimicrobiia bacterium]|nr:DUF262 domain-containing protein [Acidimicrobiia bacterium]MCY4433776.1 DUF262 domain-containing protein [bacterium]
MGIHYETTTLREIVDSHTRGKLVLPNFQREFVWSVEDQRKLLTSLLADIPIGAVLLLLGKSSDFAARRFGRQAAAEPTDECTFLLDGQQRLSCVHHFLSDPLGEEPEWERITRDTYYNLRYRWLVRVVPGQAKPDPFGYFHLHFRGIREEPEALGDFVETRRVRLAGSNGDVAHPAWLEGELADEASNEGELRYRIAHHLAIQGLVPLWEVISRADDPSSLHGMALQIIAQRRAEELAARSGPADEAILAAAQEVRPDLVQARDDVTYTDLADVITSMSATWVKAMRDHFDELGDREVPQVILPGEEIDRAIPIFEVMNQGGTPLTTFDLVVAKMARLAVDRETTERSLAEQLIQHASDSTVEVTDARWNGNSALRPELWRVNEYNFVVERDSLSNNFKNALLNILSVKAHSAGSSVADLDTDHIKRPAILKLDAAQIEDLWKDAANAVIRAWAFLSLRCGIRNSADLRNKLILLPIAFAVSDDEIWGYSKALDQLEYWYWCTTLAGTYTERQTDNCVNDIKQLNAWLIEGEPNPFTGRESHVLAAPKYSDDTTLLRLHEEDEVTSDVGDYIAQYVLSRNPQDFLEGARLAAWDFEQELELHHVIPLQTATSVGESTNKLRSRAEQRHVLNSPLNRTFILKRSNRLLGARPVHNYMEHVPTSSPLTHLLPSGAANYQKQSTEDDDQYYQRVLRMRYDHLKQAIYEELGRLLG